jgi:hypothetical protein
MKSETLEKLKSRKLWAAVLGAVIVAVGTQLGLSEQAALEISALIVAYIVGNGLAASNAAGLEKLTSRKMWITVAGVAVVAFAEQIGLAADVTQKLVALLSAYMIGNGLKARAEQAAPVVVKAEVLPSSYTSTSKPDN